MMRRHEGGLEPIINEKKMEALLCIFIYYILVKFLYGSFATICILFWSLLTPEQEILEISMIILCIGILVLVKLITEILTSRLSKNFENLKIKNVENVKKIAQLESELKNLRLLLK